MLYFDAHTCSEHDSRCLNKLYICYLNTVVVFLILGILEKKRYDRHEIDSSLSNHYSPTSSHSQLMFSSPESTCLEYYSIKI